MATKKRYIPVKDKDFFVFQGNLVNIVVTNAPAWGIPAPAVAALVARRAEFEPLFTIAENKTTRRRADVVAFRQSRKLYEKEIRAFVKAWLINNPLVTDEQRSEMALTIRDTEPTPRGKIDVIPYVNLKAIGGGDVQVRCRTEKDQTRASMHPLADAIECRYILVPVGEMPPAGQKDAKNTQVSRKARFTVSLGDEQAGQRFYGFFRWANLTNPQNSGPWSPTQTVIIA
jgi:hypothetical protein